MTEKAPTPTRDRLLGRAAIVTGAARGIGFATAKRLLQDGASVALWDRDAARLASSALELKTEGAVVTQTVDQSDLGTVERATEKTALELGGVDILVNNAGIAGPNTPLWEYNPRKFREVIEINLVGVFHCCRAVVPHLRKRGRGRIVNVASVAGKEGNPNASAYSASKAGVIALTKSLAKELTADNVLVNCITPAAVETEIFAQMTQPHIDYMRSKIPMGRFGSVEEIAAMIAFLCSDEMSFSTGAVFDISGGRATY